MEHIFTSEKKWFLKIPAYVQAYDQLDKTYDSVYQNAAKELVKQARVQPGCTVVELGSGTGNATTALWEALGGKGEIFGIDLSPAMLESARQKFKGIPQVQFVNQDVYNLKQICEAQDLVGKVDLVFSSFCYMDMDENRENLIRQVFEVLKPGGCFAFNITALFSSIRIEDQIYNKYGRLFFDTLENVLEENGTPEKFPPKDKLDSQYNCPDPEMKWLKDAGFQNIKVDAWPLTLEAYRIPQWLFDGFYKHGVKPLFSKVLSEMEESQRLALYQKAVDLSEPKIRPLQEKQRIMNFVAVK